MEVDVVGIPAVLVAEIWWSRFLFMGVITILGERERERIDAWGELAD